MHFHFIRRNVSAKAWRDFAFEVLHYRVFIVLSSFSGFGNKSCRRYRFDSALVRYYGDGEAFLSTSVFSVGAGYLGDTEMAIMKYEQ